MQFCMKFSNYRFLKCEAGLKKKILVIAIFGIDIFTSYAMADSFWNHNGSLMRLRASDHVRVFEYEIPAPKINFSGVQRGTVLFNGMRQDNRYTGIARVFSKYCDAPLEYRVEGRALTETYIVLTGQREIYTVGCVPTGRLTQDTLEFTYVSKENQASVVLDNLPSLTYLSTLLHKASYKISFNALFNGQYNIEPWLNEYVRNRNGVEHPGEMRMVGRKKYEFYEICEPHNCPGNGMYVFFEPGGAQAWALFTKEDGTSRFFGNPDTEMQIELRAATHHE